MLIGKGQWKGGRGGIWWDAARRRWIGWGGGIGVFNWIEGLLSFTSFILNFSYLSVSPIFTLLGSSNLSKELQINVKFLEVLRLFFFYFFYFLTLQYCMGFAIYQHESATGIHVSPILNPPPSSLCIPSLWVVPVHQPQASSIVHRTWTGDSFHIWYYSCFNAILPNHSTLSLSHRVQKTVLYISVSFAVSYTGLLLPSF